MQNLKELIFVDADKLKGFNFGYFLVIKKFDANDKITMIIECNNTGVEDGEEKTKEKTLWQIEYNGLVCKKLQDITSNSVLLIPVFLRPHTSDGKSNIYTHSLTSQALNTNMAEIKRVDLQLIAMIQDAKIILNNKGYCLADKVILTGFSASAKFAQRFAFLHPEIVNTVIAGGIGATICLPISKYTGIELNYPIGTADYENYTGKKFNKKDFYKIKQYFFMGDKDDNDPLLYQDCFTDKEREITYKILGKDMQNERWDNMIKIINKLKLNHIKCYKIKDVKHSPNGIFDILDEKLYKKIF